MWKKKKKSSGASQIAVPSLKTYESEFLPAVFPSK